MTEYEVLGTKLSEIADINGTMAILAWDQETMMPAGGASRRARQMATIHGISHHKFLTEVASQLDKAEQSTGYTQVQQRNLIKVREDLTKARKLPTDHIMALSLATSEATHAWTSAKKENSFSDFQPHLEKLLDLKLKETELLGYEDNPYDALLDQYEPDLKAAQVQRTFDGFKSSLLDLLQEVRGHQQVEDSFLKQDIGKDTQMEFGLQVVKAMGYDLNHGRQDLSAHPFSIGISPSDVRITTMVQKDDIREMLFSSIHEGGHAIYEQGLDEGQFGWPACQACSLSIHESQSRLWENNVGRSLAFWEHFADPLRKLFPDKLKGKSVEDIFKAMNRVQPNLVRISSDELTYHFHIILRFELELDLINRRLKVKDLPEAWNDKVKNYLGLDVPEPQKGVLQDIHWSHGSFGYFPTYSLGSFYSAQFMNAAQKAMPNLQNSFAKGDFSGLKDWLNKEIHAHGRLYNAEELSTMVTGEGLNIKYFVDYAREKFGRVYG